MDKQNSMERLIQSIQDKDEIVRKKAILALGTLILTGSEDEEAKSCLIQGLQDESVKVRKSVVLILKRWENKRVPELLIQALDDESEIVRAETVLALGGFVQKGFTNTEIEDALIQAIQDESQAVRKGVVWLLCSLIMEVKSADEWAVLGLVRGLKSGSNETRQEASLALDGLVKQGFIDRQILEAIIEEIEDSDED